MREWLPALAAALGAKPPRHYPLWAGRLFMGDALAVMAQAPRRRQRQGKTELGWTLRYPQVAAGPPPAYGRPQPLTPAA